MRCTSRVHFVTYAVRCTTSIFTFCKVYCKCTFVKSNFMSYKRCSRRLLHLPYTCKNCTPYTTPSYLSVPEGYYTFSTQVKIQNIVHLMLHLDRSVYWKGTTPWPKCTLLLLLGSFIYRLTSNDLPYYLFYLV